MLIMNNLNIHKMLDVQLWALAHERVSFLFQPTYAPLKGRSFTAVDEMAIAIQQGTANWNEHRHPYRWRKAA